VISGTMPKWQRYVHTFGSGFMCLFFCGLGLLCVRLLLTREAPSAKVPYYASVVVMLTMSAGLIAMLLRSRRRIVTEFTYDGRALRFCTLGAPEMQIRDLSEIDKIQDWQGRGGSMGYRFRFRDGAKIYVEYAVSNAVTLAETIRQQISGL
jgi:hypothetical protein